MKFFRYIKKLLVIFISGISFSATDFYSDSWALLIGINEYQYETPLHYAVADAKEMKRLLSEKLDFPDKNITILLDSAATLQGIRRSIEDLENKTSENDRVLIYFGGHGKTKLLPGGGEMGFLIPVNGKSSNLSSTSLPMSEMKQISRILPAKDILFLMDACYSGLMGIESMGVDLNDNPPLEQLAAGGSRTVITAGQKDEIAQARAEWGHSAMVKSLIYGLDKGMADKMPRDGYITETELFTHLQYQVYVDTDQAQKPSISHFTTEQGQFVFIIDKVDVQIENDAEDEFSELKKQLKFLQDQMAKQTELMLVQVEQREQAEKIDKINSHSDTVDVGSTVDEIKNQGDSKEKSGIVYKGNKLEALEEEMEELNEEMGELSSEMGLLTEEMMALQDEINEAEDMEEGKEEAIKHLQSEMDRVGGKMGTLGGKMGTLGGEMGRVGGKIEKLKKQKKDSVNELLEKLKDLGIESEEISKISDNIPFIKNDGKKEKQLVENTTFTKSPTLFFNEFGWARFNRSEGLYLQVNKTFQSEYIPGSSFYGGIGRAFHRNEYQWIFGYEQLAFKNIFQFYFEAFDKSITRDAWRVWDGENSLAAFFLKKDYLDWHRGQGFRTAGFIHIKNYVSIGAEYNQVNQSLMSTVLDGDKFQQVAYKIQEGDNSYLKSVVTAGYPIDIEVRRKLQFYTSIYRTQSIKNTNSPYVYDHFSLNLLVPYTDDLNFNIILKAGASDVADSIWNRDGYHQDIYEIGGKGTLRGYDWKQFASSHYFLTTLEIWFDEIGLFYDRAVIFDSPGNTFNSDYFEDLGNYITSEPDIYHSAGISFGSEDLSLSFIRKLNGDNKTNIYLTIAFDAPLQYW